LSKIGKNIKKIQNLLKKGKIIAMPTETVYGLAGNAYKENIIKKIFKIKKRPKCKPIIIHDHSIESIKKYVKEFPEKALKLAKHF
jgi:L-threonylcarbamoyladenylate synthase